MKLWVDDMKDPSIAEMFGLEEGYWVWVENAQDAREFLFSSAGPQPVSVLALDNDLGWDSTHDGRELAKEILEAALDDPSYIPPTTMVCISNNPVAEDAIRATFADILRVVADRE